MSNLSGVSDYYKTLLDTFKAFDEKYDKQKTNLSEPQKALYDVFKESITKSRFIDAFIFFMFFNIQEVQTNGLIVTNPVDKNGSLNINNAGKRGFYIKQVTNDSNGNSIPKDLTVDTPIIYNLGDYHFVPGIAKISSEMLHAIQKNYLDLTSLMGRAPITARGASAYNIENELQEEEEINCRFFGNDMVTYAGDKYLINEVINNDEQNDCTGYKATIFKQIVEQGQPEAIFEQNGEVVTIEGEQFKNFNKYAVFEP